MWFKNCISCILVGHVGWLVDLVVNYKQNQQGIASSPYKTTEKGPKEPKNGPKVIRDV